MSGCKLAHQLVSVISVLTAWLCLSLITPSAAAAFSRADYFDWGPYYNNSQPVLGITFSSLEELPAPGLPPEAIPAAATGILPGNPFYPMETFFDNLQLTFTFNAVQREQLRLTQASERFQEAVTLAHQNRPDLAATAAENYRRTLETAAQNLANLAQNLTPQVTSLLDQVNQTAATNTVVAQTSALTTPPVLSGVWTDLTAGAQTLMDAAADAQNLPPIPDTLSANIQELKNQGLISSEQADRLYGLDSRSQVRADLEKLVTSGQVPLSVASELDQAVAARYPQVFSQNQDVLQFAELRTYQTLPSPPQATVVQLTDWTNRADPTLPPPETIRPYLYYLRAQDLAQNLDLSSFTSEHQAELAKFYPEAVTANPTYSPPPIPSPSPLPLEVGPSPSPTPPSVTTAPYLGEYHGPLPGSPGYFFKQVGETFRSLTTFAPAARVELNLDLATERLREAAALASANPDSPAYQTTLSRYQTFIDTTSQTLSNITDDKIQDQLAQDVEAAIARHNTVLEKGVLPPPPDKPELLTTAIRSTEDVLDAAADALDRPSLPLALAHRLQDLKAQSLITPEEVNQLTQANSRSAVRQELRQLLDAGTFPPADAKKLDEAQALISPQDYNQLVEVRKIEELQGLRAIQAEFAQTATLRATTANYDQRLEFLRNSIDPALIDPTDLAGQPQLLALYNELAGSVGPRPINAGQFLPAADQADYAQYRCDLPGQYWSFVANACVSSDPNQPGYRSDSQPQCPPLYTWSWSVASCTLDTGAGLPSPSPTPTPLPDETPACPQGAAYQPPRGCVWDDTDRSVNDYNQYRCTGESQYYSFSQKTCVPAPEGETALPPADTTPPCSQDNTYFSWSDGRCLPYPTPYTPPDTTVAVSQPNQSFISADSPFAFLDHAFETLQTVTAFTPEAKARVRLAQARERFGESYDLLTRGKQDQFGKVLGEYTDTMQQIFNDVAKGVNFSDSAAAGLGTDLKELAVQDNLLLQQATALTSAAAATPIAAATSVTIQALDRAADLAGEPPLPAELQSKIQELPAGMLTPEQQDALLNPDSRLEARLALGELTTSGIISPADTAFLDQPLTQADPKAVIQVNQLKVLGEIATLSDQKQQLETKVTQTEDIAKKLDEFQKTFTPGQDVPAEIRPYLRLSRIEEVAQTVRPDLVRLEDFGNRKDIQLAVATLQQEFKPTRESWERVERFRRNNPGQSLPPDLARVEALSFSLGVRNSAGPCFLPSPPFAANTPCPPPGAAISVANYYTTSAANPYPGLPGFGSTPYSSTPQTGEQLTYGKGPQTTSPGACPDGYHFMYDSGGWCMSNSGSYGSTSPAPYTSTAPGYTPYSPYYAPPGTPTGTYFPTPGSGGYYSPPSYYGPAPTSYTTTPPPGTVPGTGPAPTASGQCPQGFHWMAPTGSQAGWCMADGGTYVPSGTATYPNYVTPPQSCPAGQSWSSAVYGCIPTGSTPGYYSPNLTQSSCGPGYYWDGRGCIGTTPATSTYPTSTSTPTYSGSGSTTGGCTYPSGGCGSGWYDWGSCSCRSSSDTTSTSTAPSSGGTSSSGSCPSGYHWMSDSGGWCMSDGGGGGGSTSTYTPPSSPTPSTTESSPAPAPTTTTSEPVPAPTSSEPTPTTSP